MVAPRTSKLVEWPLAFDAVELLGLPVDALFDHFETVGVGSSKHPTVDVRCVVDEACQEAGFVRAHASA
jgi:hypothetical protein